MTAKSKKPINPLHIDFVTEQSSVYEKKFKPIIRNEPLNILIVEDNIVDSGFLSHIATTQGHKIHLAGDGQQALDFLRSNPKAVDIIMMDRLMPVMDGLTSVQHIKEDPILRRIPVIMVTGTDMTGGMESWLREGVIYYITKPADPYVLSAVLNAAAREIRQSLILSEELQKYRSNFNMIDTCKFKYQTLAEAEALAPFIALCFPDPERVLPGLGELMINAVEHGNLGIGYVRKTELLDQGVWRSEIERREMLEQNQNKFITASIKRQKDGIVVVIEDEGEGFDWKKFIKIDLVRAGHSHGRGIAQARALSFDKLSYNEKGNQVVAFVGHSSGLKW